MPSCLVHTGDESVTLSAATVKRLLDRGDGTAEHGQRNAQQQTGCADHLAHLKAGGGNGSQQVVVSGHVTGFLEVDEVVGPCQPQRVLTKHLAARIDTGGNGVGAAEGSVVHGDGQHVVQTEGQQQTLQRAIDERSQNGRSLGRVCDPDAKVVDVLSVRWQKKSG